MSRHKTSIVMRLAEICFKEELDIDELWQCAIEQGFIEGEGPIGRFIC